MTTTKNTPNLSERETTCLKAIYAILGDAEEGQCTYFHHIAKRTKLTEPEARRATRSLAKKGFAEFHRGLFDEDGKTAGSGYCLTATGTKHAESLVAIKPLL